MKNPDPLSRWWPVWAKNAEESAQFLRSGEKYEEWCKSHGITPKSPEDREAAAVQYDAKAEKYRKRIQENQA